MKAMRIVAIALTKHVSASLLLVATFVVAASSPAADRNSRQSNDPSADSKPSARPAYVPTGEGVAAVVGKDEFRWRGKIDIGRTVEILSLSGKVTVEPSKGNDVEVIAIKRSVRGNAEQVSIEVIEHSGGVTVCAVLPDNGSFGDTPCRPGATAEAGKKPVPTGRRNPLARRDEADVRVDYILRVPTGVRVNTQGADGEVRHHWPDDESAWMGLASRLGGPPPCPDTRRP